MSRFVTVRNEKGRENVISQKTWDLMSSKSERGNTRKGWTLVDPAAKPPTATAGAPKQPTPTFVPPEIEEATKKAAEAETAKAAGMIAAEPEQPAAKADSSPEPPASDQAQDLTKISGIGAKVAELLAANGISTYSALAAAPITGINKALDEASMSAKKAEVPKWKMAAAELAKA